MKRLIKAILWIACYGGAGWWIIKDKLGLDITMLDHWKLLFDKSVHVHWPANMADKKLVCKVLLAFIIVGILGLAVICRKKKTRIPVVQGDLPNPENNRPTLMASQGKIVSTTPVSVPPTPVAGPNPNVSIPNSVPTGNIPAPPAQSMSIPPTNTLTEAIRTITSIANTFDVSVFQHVKLENTLTQLVISDDSTALLFKILPQQGPWQIEMPPTPEESLWTLANETPRNILKDIMNSTATLARLEPDAQTIAVIAMAGGSINNAAIVRQYLNQHGIRIVTLDNLNTPEIPTLQELLNEFYPLKQGENYETENTSQTL